MKRNFKNYIKHLRSKAKDCNRGSKVRKREILIFGSGVKLNEMPAYAKGGTSHWGDCNGKPYIIVGQKEQV